MKNKNIAKDDEEQQKNLIDMLKLEIKMKTWQFYVILIVAFCFGVIIA